MKSWQKQGLIYTPSAKSEYLASHAANPLAIHLENDVFRVFFSGRNQDNKSSVGCVDIDIVRQEVVQQYDEPLFVFGAQGSFYSHGVSIGNMYIAANKTCYIPFMGWQIKGQEHWRGDVGRLVLGEDKKTLTLDSEVPFMGSDSVDLVSLSYPWVEQWGTSDYRMWYGSTVTWDAGNGEMLHVLNYATSHDGEDWLRHGLSIPFKLGTVQAFSRPTLLRGERDSAEMWFSYRGAQPNEKYKIGYASTQDGQTWKLDCDKAGIAVSDKGWDSEMICYPYVFTHKANTYMLYNGNSHGKTGIGLAIRTEKIK